MGLASIANVPYDENSLNEWAFSHNVHHIDVASAIFRVHGVQVPLYPFDPFNPNDTTTFGYQHQQVHNVINAILGVSGNDLVDVNWKDPEQRQIWIDLDFREHQQWNDALGV